MGFTDIIDYLQGNPYFGAGAGLFGIGAASAVLRKSFMIGTILFKRNYTTSLEVTSRDASYMWLLKFINEKVAKDSLHVSTVTNFVQMQSGKSITRQDFTPNVGLHYFWYKNNLIKCERNRENTSVNLTSGAPFEYVKLSTIGRKRDLFSEMLNDSKEMVEVGSKSTTVIYTPFGSEWRMSGHPRNRRPLSSVVFDKGIKEAIVDDVQDFLNSSKWYIDRGIPFRRGYLLHGPPGCGKSSFVSALAAHLDMSVSTLALSDRGLTDDRLKHLVAVAPESSLILLEDVDAAFVSRNESDKVKSAYDGLSPLTFSGLLNTLDGVDSTENRLVFLTTNHVERLDSALIRPGRVDMIKEIGLCSAYQLQQMFIRFYDTDYSTADDKERLRVQQLAITFAQRVLEVRPKISPAEVQGYFMQHKKDRETMLGNVNDLTSSFWNK